ncbi:MAG: secondary thiamine-phosphate synthase enzyme YjbQ [Pseudomonadota bacterium]
MRQLQEELLIETPGKALVDCTRHIAAFVGRSAIEEGLVTLFLRHTSASLLIQENADPDVLRDMETFFARLVPEEGRYRHASEGPDDMPAHIRAALTQTSLSIPIRAGEMALGTWQGIYLYEHRTRPHRRKLLIHLLGQ